VKKYGSELVLFCPRSTANIVMSTLGANHPVVICQGYH